MATAFTFRQFNRRGIDAAVVGWTLAVCGMYSSLGFALVLTGGAVASQSAAAAVLGCVGAVVSLAPTLAVLAALPALKNPTISSLSDPDWVAVNTIIEESVVRQILPRLKSAKAQGIVEYPLNKIVL